jgi:hypothetical protein
MTAITVSIETRRGEKAVYRSATFEVQGVDPEGCYMDEETKAERLAQYIKAGMGAIQDQGNNDGVLRGEEGKEIARVYFERKGDQ